MVLSLSFTVLSVALCASLSSAAPIVDLLSPSDIDANVGPIVAPVKPVLNTGVNLLNNLKPDVTVIGAKNARDLPLLGALNNADANVGLDKITAPISPVLNTGVKLLENVKPDITIIGAKNARSLPLADVLSKANLDLDVEEIYAPVLPVLNTGINALNSVKPDVTVIGAKNARDEVSKRTEPHHPTPRPVHPPSIPAIIVSLTAQLKPLLDQLKSLIGGKAHGKPGTDIDIDLVIDLLATVQGLLGGALNEIKALIKLDLDLKGLLQLDGKVLGLLDLSRLLSQLLHTLFSTVAVLLVGLGGGLRVNIVKGLLAGVFTIVAELLAVLFGTVKGLKFALGPLLGGVLAILRELDIKVVLKVLVN